MQIRIDRFQHELSGLCQQKQKLQKEAETKIQREHSHFEPSRTLQLVLKANINHTKQRHQSHCSCEHGWNMQWNNIKCTKLVTTNANLTQHSKTQLTTTFIHPQANKHQQYVAKNMSRKKQAQQF
jgi:hypothetical protein